MPPERAFTAIDAGAYHSCGVTREGSILCWGWNADGQDPASGQVSDQGQEGLRYDGSCPYEGLGMMYLKQGRVQEAGDNLEKAAELNGNIELDKLQRLAEMYVEEERYAQAEALLLVCLERSPQDGLMAQGRPRLEELLREVRAKRGEQAR